MTLCPHCTEELTDHEVPFMHDSEAWCPQCFAWQAQHAAKNTDGSAVFGYLSAVECGACKKVSVSTSGACPQCGSSATKQLGPKTHEPLAT